MARIAITNGVAGGSTRRAATNYGPRTNAKGVPTQQSKDETVVLEIPFDYANLPDSGADLMVLSIPVNARIESCRLTVNTAFAGGTSYAIGLEKKSDGTAIDAAGLITAANAPLANINAKGKVVVGSGALVGTVLAYEAQVAVVATGTFTAGEGVIRLEYTPLVDRI